MGYLRLWLAFLVLISHFLSLYGYSYEFNFGVSSVVIFYILAGYVTARLWFDVFNRNIRLFIADRFLRIYPSYFVAGVVCLLFLVYSNFGVQDISLKKLFLNFILIPVNFYMVFPDRINVLFAESNWWPLIPPAWSLAVEVQAYVVMALLLKRRLMFAVAFLVSMIVSVAARSGVIDPDLWGYRFLPGVLMFFLAGGVIFMYVSEMLDGREKLFYQVLFGVYIAVSLAFLLKGKVFVFTRETFAGFVCGIMLLFIFLLRKSFSNLNRIMAFLSYPVFLNHFTAIYMTKHFFPDAGLLQAFVVVAVITIILSIPMVYIDLKLLSLRVVKNSYN